MTDSDERGLQLMTWIDEHWSVYPNQRVMLAAANIQIRPVLTGREQDWLAREWQARQGEREDAVEALNSAAEEPASSSTSGAGSDQDAAAGTGAPEAAEGSAPDGGVDPDLGDEEGVVVDAETGEILEEDIPFEVDAEADDEDAGRDGAGRELEVAAPLELASLFGPGGPELAMQIAARYAVAFREFVVANDLTLEMEDGTLYVTSAGWEAGGQMTGVFTEIEGRPEQLPGGWMVKAYAHRPSTGERWTSAWAVCLRSEKGKKWHSEHDLLAMAETRARRLALRPAISILVTAAGFDATPPDERKASPKQHAKLQQIFEQMAAQPGARRTKEQWHDQARRWTRQRFGKQQLRELNRLEISQVIDGMQRKLDQTLAGEADDGGNPVGDELAGAEV